MRQLSNDCCSVGLPLRYHSTHECAPGCDYTNAIFHQAIRDELDGVTIDERFAFESAQAKADRENFRYIDFQ